MGISYDQIQCIDVDLVQFLPKDVENRLKVERVDGRVRISPAQDQDLYAVIFDDGDDGDEISDYAVCPAGEIPSLHNCVYIQCVILPERKKESDNL